MKAIIRQTLFLFLSVVTFSVYGQSLAPANTCATDSTKIVARLPLADHIEKFKNDPDFQYKKEIIPPTTWWDAFKQWFGHLIARLFSGVNPDWVLFIFVIIVASVAVFVVLKLMGINVTGLFSRKGADIDLPYSTVGEDVRIMDFDKLISDAINNKNYRLAVRLFYLKTLKELNTRSLITWKPEKTNRHYLTELSSTALKGDFEHMTYQFEYVWYGEFELEEQEFNIIQGSFLSFQKQIAKA